MNLTPITQIIIEGFGEDRVETTTMISYAEAISKLEEVVNISTESDPVESVDILDDILRYTVKKIIQDHCS